LSFRLFASKLYKGNVSRSAQQGVLWASFALVALLLQIARALTLMNVLILVAAFVLVQFIALGRR
ncbi:MAG: hypothetical protein M1358_19340, partial [Chloroflexi bacterium]|nr:hypothetical protein [Chloroflexota bacterium]